MIANTSHETFIKLTILTGTVAFLLTLANSAQFYASLGNTSFGTASYIVSGLLLTTLTVLLLSLGAFLYKEGKVVTALFLITAYAVLLTLEISAQFGHYATEQETRAAQVAINSEPAQMAKFNIDLAEKELQRLSQHANVDISVLEQQKATIENRISSLQSQLAACPKGYNTKCINPANEKIAQAHKELLPVQLAINGYSSYQAAMSNKERAMSEYTSVSTGNGVQLAISPAYTWLSLLTGIEVKKIQVFTSILISTLISLWASFAGYVMLILVSMRYSNETNDETQAMRTTQVGFIPPDFKVTPATAKIDKQANDLSNKPMAIVNDIMPMAKEGNGLSDKSMAKEVNDMPMTKKAIGGVYQCVDCGADYSARTVWQKRCPTCTAKVKAGVMRSKRKKVVTA